jgi:hypothetical protein
MPRILLAGLIAFALVMSGCKISGNSASNANANLRLVNLDAGVGAVNLTSIDYNNGQNTPTPNCPCDIQGLSFQGVSGYIGYQSGDQKVFTLSTGGGTSTLATQTFTLSSDTNYTLILFGSVGNPESMLLSDTVVNNPATGTFIIRPVHTAFGQSTLDFYVLPITSTVNNQPVVPPILNSAPTFSSFNLTGVPLFQQFTAGSYIMTVTQSGSKTILYQSNPVTFNNGDIVSADIYGSGSGMLVNIMLMYQNNSNGGTTTQNTITLEPNLFAQFKFTNAAPGLGPVNVLANNTSVFSNIPPANTTSYFLTQVASNAGTATPTLLSILSNGTQIATGSESFQGGNDYSTVLVGTPSSLGVLNFQDDNLPPSTGDAKFRFINVSPNAGPIDVQVNFQAVPGAQALATNTASPYVNYVQNPLPGYTITANITGQTTTALTLTGVEVLAGGTYTIYVTGNAGSLQGVVTRDN